MTEAMIEQLETIKSLRIRLKGEQMIAFDILPDNVRSSVHYNGKYEAMKEFAEFAELIEVLE